MSTNFIRTAYILTASSIALSGCAGGGCACPAELTPNPMPTATPVAASVFLERAGLGNVDVTGATETSPFQLSPHKAGEAYTLLYTDSPNKILLAAITSTSGGCLVVGAIGHAPYANTVSFTYQPGEFCHPGEVDDLVVKEGPNLTDPSDPVHQTYFVIK